VSFRVRISPEAEWHVRSGFGLISMEIASFA